MRDRRITRPARAAPESAADPGVRRWVLVIIAICALWLVAMVVVSVLGLEYKTPVRIEHWRPHPVGAEAGTKARAGAEKTAYSPGTGAARRDFDWAQEGGGATN